MSKPYQPEHFDRSRLRFRPVTERRSKFRIDDIAVDPDSSPKALGDMTAAVEGVAGAIRQARQRGAPVVIAHGAHLIKNGGAPLLVRLVEDGWVTHVATNGAGSLHDWEFAYMGRSTEDVRAHVSIGEFGIWEETGAYIGLALATGSLDGLGYGAAVGKLIAEEKLVVPEYAELEDMVKQAVEYRGSKETAAAALDLLAILEQREDLAGTLDLPHPWKHCSIQATCWRKEIPLTIHPGIGQDIIYSHPILQGGPVGRASIADFTCYAATIARLEGGVYLSVGSAVMSPMIFEKSLSMARNLLKETDDTLDDFTIAVNDLARIDWDWSQGEPPVDNAAYYVRFMKSFSRMGGRLQYVGMDNRDFLHNLYHILRQ